MARVTVEDCLDKVETRFDLVVLASMRASKILKNGYSESIENEKKEKATVVALREIAEAEITPEQILRNEIEG